MILATRGTGSDAHSLKGAQLDPPPIIHVRYVTATVDPPAPSGAATRAEATVKPGLNGSARELRREKARLASIQASLAGLTDRLARILPTFDVGDVMRGVRVADAAVVSDSDFARGAERLSDLVRPMVPLVKDGIYTPDLVDEQVAPRSGNPKPWYPGSLLAAGIEADVNVTFVVDTTGVVDEPSITFASHVHSLFMDAIKASLRQARFFPARFGGMVVPQLVRQEFRFEIRSR